MYDITEQKSAAQALHQSEVKFKSYVEFAPDALLVADNDGYLVDVNEAACAFSGYSRSELLVMRFTRLIHPDDLTPTAQAFSKLVHEGRTTIVTRAVTKQGDVPHWSIDGARLNESLLPGSVRDTTEVVNLAEKLHHAEKLQVVGQLAGGVAHDFNNQLEAAPSLGGGAHRKLAAAIAAFPWANKRLPPRASATP